jgi:hypothetical protein
VVSTSKFSSFTVITKKKNAYGLDFQQRAGRINVEQNDL